MYTRAHVHRGTALAPPAKMSVVLAVDPLLSLPCPRGVTSVSLPLRISRQDPPYSTSTETLTS